MKKTITILLLSVLAVACSDFLDIRPEGTNPATGMDYSKAENIFKPVSAAYATLRDYNATAFPYICLLEITSDDADKGSSPSDSPEAISLDAFSFDATNGLINSQWTAYYNIISAANNALYQLPLFREQMNDARSLEHIRQCEADARFLRGFAYFQLVRMFGGVPIVDKTMTAEELSSLPRSSAADVYDFIEADFRDAIDNLPSSWPKAYAGRATSYTAMAFKAKAHLYQKEYAQAAALCDSIIASKTYSLLSDFRKVFSIEGELCSESVFEVQVTDMGLRDGTDIPYSEYAYVQGPKGNAPGNMQGWGFCVPSESLIQFFADRGETVRAATTFLYSGTTTPEGDTILATCENPVYNGKVYTPSSYNTWRYNGYGFAHNIRIMRYSDVLLMYAECLARGESAGTLSGYTAQTALDEVRSRAGLASVTPSLDNILDERRAEFALEEDRFLDLVRTGLAPTVLASKGFTTGKHELFPIPAAQRQLNTNLEQNPGY